MKKIELIKGAAIFIAAILFHYNAYCGAEIIKTKNRDSTLCLELHCKTSKCGSKSPVTYTVMLFHYSTPVDSDLVKAGHSFKFLLNRNTWYGVKIMKEGCVPKLFNINTELPEKKYEDILYKLSFEIDELISETESKNLDADVLDFPLALIEFDKKLETFNYNKVYSVNIKKKLVDPLAGQE